MKVLKKFRLPLLIVFIVLAALSAKVAYKIITSPSFYKPNGEIILTPPVNTTSQVQTVKQPGTKALLPGAKWVPQTFNNCGPATTSMVLQYFGFNISQEETKAHLRSNSDDKNVFTYEIADYLKNDYGISSKLLYGGDITLIKKLLTNGFYIVVEDWLHPNEDIGHTTIIRGFDDDQGVLIADDSFIGVNITYPYDQFSENQWKAFNYEYLPVYLPKDEALLKSIIGASWDEEIMYQNTAAKAQSQISENDSDMYAWFNLGTSLFALKDYSQAQNAFDKSRSLGWPKRLLWYQIQPLENSNALKEYQKTLELADLALAGNNSFAEAHLEKAVAYKGLGNSQRAQEEKDIALSFFPNFKKAQNFD